MRGRFRLPVFRRKRGRELNMERQLVAVQFPAQRPRGVLIGAVQDKPAALAMWSERG